MDVVSLGLAKSYTKGNAAPIAARVPDPSADATGAADAAAIQAALTKGAGGIVAFPIGKTYRVNATMLVSSNTTVLFNGSRVQAVAATNAAVFSNKNYTTTGDSGIRMVGPGGADANRAQQAAEVCPFDFNQLTLSTFDGIEGTGGRRNNGYPTGTNGEGIVLRNSTYCDIVNGYFHDNDYDGIKLRTSSYCRIAGNTCRDNGRSGVQISMNSQTSPTSFTGAPYSTGEGVEASGSNYNTITGNKLYHSTGTPGSTGPTTSGVYIHTGVNNTVSGNSIYGFRQGVALYGGASRNLVGNNTIAVRYVDQPALFVQSGGAGSCARNQFTDNEVTWISGTNPVALIIAEGTLNRSAFNRFALTGTASGTISASVLSGVTSAQLFLDGGYGFGSLTDAGGSTLMVQTANGKLITSQGIGVGNRVAATTLGAVTGKTEVFDINGNSLGFLPIYGSIT